MSERDNSVRSLLFDAAQDVRLGAGLSIAPAHLGGKATVDTKLLEIAKEIADVHGEPPQIPRTGALIAMVIVIAVAAIVFLLALYIARDESYVTSLLVGEGTIIAGLVALAAKLAMIYRDLLAAYHERAASWQRTDAVIRVMREMSRGGPLPPEELVKLLDSLGSLFPPRGL